MAAQVCITALEVEWYRVVETGLNSVAPQGLMQDVSVGRLDRILVIDMPGVCQRHWDCDGCVGEDPVIPCSDFPPGVGPAPKMT